MSPLPATAKGPFVLLFLILAPGVAAVHAGRREVGEESRRLVQGAMTRLGDPEASARGGAARLLGTMGCSAEGAVPMLVERLDDEAPPVRTEAAQALAAILQCRRRLRDTNDEDEMWMRRMVGRLGASEAGTRQDALRVMSALGCVAEASAGVVVARLADEAAPVKTEAASVVRAIGRCTHHTEHAPAAAAAFAAGLGHADPFVRKTLLAALGDMQALAKPFAEDMARALRDGDAAVRAQAFQTLQRIEPGRRDAEPVMVEHLGDPDPRTRRSAVSQIGARGDQASPTAVRALAGQLKDPATKKAAVNALGRLGASVAPALPALAEALDDPEIAGDVVWALQGLGAHALPALPALLAHVETLTQAGTTAMAIARTSPAALAALARDSRLRKDALEALVSAHPGAAAPHLIALFQDGDSASKVAVLKALARLRQPVPEALPIVREAMVDERFRHAAVPALGRIGGGAAAESSARMLLPLTEDAALRWAACLALGDLGPAVIPAVVEAVRAAPVPSPALVCSLSRFGDAVAQPLEAVLDGPPPTRLMAALALARVADAKAPPGGDPAARRTRLAALLRGRAPTLIPELVARLDDEGLGNDARMALETIGADSVPALARALKAGSDDAVRRAAWALWKLGPDAVPATEALVSTLGHADAETRVAASRALAAIGVAAAPVLRQALLDPERRLGAALALARIPGADRDGLDAVVLSSLPGATAAQDRAAAVSMIETGVPTTRRVMDAAAQGHEDALHLLSDAVAAGRESLARHDRQGPGDEATTRRLRALVDDMTTTLLARLAKELALPSRRDWAASALSRIGSPAVSILTSAAETANAEQRAALMYPLARAGAPGATLLARVRDDPEVAVRRAAAQAYAEHALSPDEATARILQLATTLEGADGPTCAAIVSGMGRLAWASDIEKRPYLVASLQPVTRQVLERLAVAECRETAEEATVQFGAIAMPALVEALRSATDVPASWRIASLIGAGGPRARGAVPGLVLALEEPRVRAQAVEALSGIGPDAAPAAAALVRALHEPALRWKAATALGHIGEGALAPVLALAVAGDDESSREAAIVAVGHMGAAAKSAVPSLQGLAASSPPGLQAAVLAALARIQPVSTPRPAAPAAP